MENVTILDRIKPFASKLIAAFVAQGAVYIANKYGFVVSDDQQRIISEMIWTWLGLTLAHTGVSKWTNPANAASSVLTKEGSAINKDLKR